jgi:hypothetical protein
VGAITREPQARVAIVSGGAFLRVTTLGRSRMRYVTAKIYVASSAQSPWNEHPALNEDDISKNPGY